MSDQERAKKEEEEAKMEKMVKVLASDGSTAIILVEDRARGGKVEISRVEIVKKAKSSSKKFSSSQKKVLVGEVGAGEIGGRLKFTAEQQKRSKFRTPIRRRLRKGRKLDFADSCERKKEEEEEKRIEKVLESEKVKKIRGSLKFKASRIPRRIFRPPTEPKKKKKSEKEEEEEAERKFWLMMESLKPKKAK